MTKETGGSAFPAPNYIYDSARIDKDAFQRMGSTQGMTLRDFFAGQTLCGIMAHQMGIDGNNITITKSCDMTAKMCYEYADAMLAARKDSDENK